MPDCLREIKAITMMIQFTNRKHLLPLFGMRIIMPKHLGDLSSPVSGLRYKPVLEASENGIRNPTVVQYIH